MDVVGRCESTQIWTNSPVTTVTFSYTSGSPEFTPPGQSQTFEVQLTPVNDTLDPGAEKLFVSISDGPFAEPSLTPLGGRDPDGPPDFNGDNTLDTTDFLELLAHWGNCP